MYIEGFVYSRDLAYQKSHLPSWQSYRHHFQLRYLLLLSKPPWASVAPSSVGWPCSAGQFSLGASHVVAVRWQLGWSHPNPHLGRTPRWLVRAHVCISAGMPGQLGLASVSLYPASPMAANAPSEHDGRATALSVSILRQEPEAADPLRLLHGSWCSIPSAVWYWSNCHRAHPS